MKNLLFATVVAFLALTSCKKEEYVKKEDLKKIESIDLTIESSQWQWNSLYKSWEYSYSHSFINDGVLVGYVMTGQGKQALPYYDASNGVTTGLMDNTYDGKIVVTYYDGSTTLQKPSGQKYVYLKVIPSSQMKPNVDYSNHQAVIEAHKL